MNQRAQELQLETIGEAVRDDSDPGPQRLDQLGGRVEKDGERLELAGGELDGDADRRAGRRREDECALTVPDDRGEVEVLVAARPAEAADRDAQPSGEH